MEDKVIVITGGTSGIGSSTVKALLNKNCKIYELSRREGGQFSQVTHISADITKPLQIKNAVNLILEKEKRIDVLINNAGFGISGAIEFTELSEAKRQFDVNFFGLVNMTQEILPVMRVQKSGRIINVASVAADIAIPFQAFYSASKAAIKSYSNALSIEMNQFNVQVCSILPGDIKTGFTAARQKNILGDEEYSGKISRSVAVMEHDEQNGMNPDVIGKFIAKIALKRKIGPVYTIGFKYKFFVFLVRIIPASWVNFLVRMIYAS